jgi:hypothetical protein
MKQLLVGVMISLPVTVIAEDVRTIVAALNDPYAECRYLTEKRLAQRTALQEHHKATSEFIQATKAMENAPKYSQERKNLFQIVEITEDHTKQTGLISRLATRQVKTIENVIRARRGSLEQCQPKREQVPSIANTSEE